MRTREGFTESSLKVARPWTATIGGVLSIISGLWLAFILDPSDFELYIISWLPIIFGGALILRRDYKVGGALVLAFSILTFFAYEHSIIGRGTIGMSIMGGVLGLISNERVEERVLGMAKLFWRMKISDVAAKLAITEADVELTVINLQSKGEVVKFDVETREVIYGYPEFVTVQGVVTDKDGNSVKDAVVEIGGLSVTTGSDGGYVINGVPINTKTITVRAPGAEVVKRALKISKGAEIIMLPPLVTPPILSVTITYPSGEASSPTRVEGTVSRALKEGEYMWIAVNPSVCPGEWWPQTGGPIKPSEETLTWKGIASSGVEKQDISKEFDIAVLVLNDELNSKFKDYLRACEEKKDWPPITKEKIQKGVIEEKILDRDTVVLKEVK